FERRRLPVEIRRDPLTGHTSRLLPAGSLQPPARLELEQLAEQSRDGCPFCAERVEEVTPRFPPELWPEGRIRRGEALLFPNLVPYARWSSVSIYSPRRHFLPLAELSAELLSDNLAAQVAFARAVLDHDPESRWASVNANHMPPSGSSIFHPHLQGTADPRPTTMQRLLADVPSERYRGYVDAERRLGERYLGATGGVEWLASFAPIGPAELRAFVFDAASPADLDDGRVAELGRGLARALAVYAELGFQGFNLALYGAPPGTRGYPLNLRLVARSTIGALRRSDVMWSERLHWEAATDLAPEALAETARQRFARAAA
ncbi:MAG: hypothetical protein ACXVZN_12830, partial [Gaiellaceae bacterium]